MRKYKQFLTILGVCLLSVGITACSTSVQSETQTIPPETTEIQKHVSEAETPETTTTAVGEETAPQGFDSPERAIAAYLEGLKVNDLKAMLATFGGDTYARHYLSQEAAKRGQTDAAALSVPEEESTEAVLARSVFTEGMNGDISDDILRQYAIFFELNQDPKGYIKVEEDGKAEELLEQMSNKMQAVDFTSLKLLGFIPPGNMIERYSSGAHQKNLPDIAKGYGADAFDSRIAAIQIGKKKYVIFFDVVEYDGKWFNLQLGGTLANMAALDKEMVGTILLDAEDEKVLKQSAGLVPYDSQNVYEMEKASNSSLSIEGKGYDSPQEAAKAYLEALKESDLSRMMSTFAVETYVDHFDIQAQIEFTDYYTFMSQEINLPVVNDFSRDLNMQSRKKKIREGILKQYGGIYNTTIAYSDNTPRTDDVVRKEQFISTEDMVNTIHPNSIEILGYIPFSTLSEVYDLEKFEKNTAEKAKRCGADKMEASALIFELGKTKYFFCVDTVEYNGKWYNKELGGTLVTILDMYAQNAGIESLDNDAWEEFRQLLIPFA